MGKNFIVLLPDIGEGVVEGEVIEWLKKVGDPLAKDEPVVVVMTDKATVELPAPYPGTLVKQHFKPGEVAIKDKPLYEIEVLEGVNVQQSRHHEPQVKPSSSLPQPKKPLPVRCQNMAAGSRPPAQEESAGRIGRPLASPKTRKRAKELGIALEEVPGSGMNGIITLEDLQKSISSKAGYRAAPSKTAPMQFEGDERKPLMGLRKAVAEKMVESKTRIPHFAYFETMDATRLVQMRERSKAAAMQENIKLTYMPFFIRALSLCLKEFPLVNASIDDETHEIVFHKQQNVGIAIKTPLGLTAPVLKGVQQMTFHEIIKAYDTLMQKGKTNKLGPQEMKGSTVTISNFGTEGRGEWATPIINYPEACILGLARIRKTPAVKNDTLVIRESLNLSWCFDHRLIDGDLAAAFSACFIHYLENPASIL